MPGAAVPGRGQEVVTTELGPYLVRIATGFGPRVTGLALGDGPEMFAQLPPEVAIDHPESGVYRFHGGHRLWAAPELPMVSYAPDDHVCQVTRSGQDVVTITAPPDRAGMAKSIRIGRKGGRLTVDHVLANQGDKPLEVAPWAITQMPLGGTALVPTAWEGAESLQATGTISLWSYSDLSDPRLRWRSRAMIVAADAGPAFKIGVGPDPGRLGYLRGAHLFVKEVTGATAAGLYADRGAVGQLYLNDSFCELESLGAIARLETGETAAHRETWWIEPCDDLDQACQRVIG